MTREDEPTETTRLLPPESREADENAIQNADDLHVDWESPSDPSNPKNWPSAQKWLCAMLVSIYSLIAPTAAAMVVPAMPALARDLHITSSGMLQMTLSAFVLGWGTGPLILGPLSEVFGRAPLLHVGQLGFMLINVMCALVRNPYVFLFLRFVSGLFGSGPTALGAGVLSDLWVSDERGVSLAIYTIMPLLGPTAGPLLGGYIIQYYDWKYIFYLCSSLTGFFLVFGIFLLPETFGPMILHRKRLAKLKKMNALPRDSAWGQRLKSLIGKSLSRPFVLLGTQPIIQVLAVYFGFLFGLYQLTISTFHSLWKDVYGESDMVSSLNYISMTVGLIVGCEIAGPLNDKIYRTLKRRNNNVDLPEYRIWLMLPAATLVPLGMIWFGWSAAAKSHWIMPNLGMGVAAVGLVMGFQCMQAYVMDAYPIYAASAMGALTVLRSLAGFVMPIFAPALNRSLGYGWASTLLAVLAAIVGGVTPGVLYWKGATLRAQSPYAAGDVKVIL
ncbi:putative florfenicol exporter [Aspergillus avenaceus]|uniref:Putative florfenicol exporter n=1 Tax=Aspergillus avenaceus TaxID=36643 RepID=A0A5N6U5H7_ASPAV|nr:putative florfenicol exporter [Aspergillus avenaceus]